MTTLPPVDSTSQPASVAHAPASPEPKELTTFQKVLIGLVALLLLAGVIAAVYYLVNSPAQAQTVRDIFIIFMALEFMVIGAALTVLMVQLAVLTNLLKNEIQPILESTNEAVNTVRGTAAFVSENLSEPIIKLNSYLASVDKILGTFGALGNLMRKK